METAFALTLGGLAGWLSNLPTGAMLAFSVWALLTTLRGALSDE